MNEKMARWLRGPRSVFWGRGAMLRYLYLLAGFAVGSCSREGPVTVTSLSPDDEMRVELIESRFRFIDRNFRIRLQVPGQDERLTLFASPDEGMPEGSERFIWSKDGTYFLLVGRHFFCDPPLSLANGEQAYFLYHLPTGQGWCNSHQQKLPRMTKEMLDAIEFTEKLQYEKPPVTS